jgi:hypothetical protein
VRGDGLTAVRMEDGSTRVRASDVEQLIRTRARRHRISHTPSTGPCGIGDSQVLPVAQWALIFGAAHPSYIVVNEPVIPCPRWEGVWDIRCRRARVRMSCSTSLSPPDRLLESAETDSRPAIDSYGTRMFIGPSRPGPPAVSRFGHSH